jgi:hypothetical protein
MQPNTNNSIKCTQAITNQKLQFGGGIAALIIAFAYMISIALFVTLLKPDSLLSPMQ